MTKEELIAMGLTPEQVDNVLKAYKKNLDGNFVPRERFNDVNNKLKTANETITNRDAQIENLKAFEGTNEELKNTITTLQQENATEKQRHQTELANMRKQEKVKDYISNHKRVPHNVNDVLSTLDLDKIQVDDDQLIGINEQYDKLVQEKPYWFKEEQPKQPEQKLFGFNFKGQEPKEGEGNGGSTLNKQEQFGKALAQSNGAMDTAKNAMDYFFGKN